MSALKPVLLVTLVPSGTFIETAKIARAFTEAGIAFDDPFRQSFGSVRIATQEGIRCPPGGFPTVKLSSGDILRPMPLAATLGLPSIGQHLQMNPGHYALCAEKPEEILLASAAAPAVQTSPLRPSRRHDVWI